MIEVRNLRKSFGETEVLKGIDFTFDRGKTNLIIGQSGSGKTVFIKCMVGLHRPDSGEIRFDGENMLEMSYDERKLLRQNIGMVFQGGALFDSLTVEENVMFPMNLFSQKSQEEKLDRVNFCLKRVNLNNVNKLLPAELSGGMQKRVAIARAIVMEPKYLFCDEPNSGLDPNTAIVIDNLVQEITEEYQITTVINTHDMNSVMEIGEKIIFLKNGVRAWNGTRDDLFHTDNKELVDFVFSSRLFKKVREVGR
jgi:phospholipid/cholesterol/gamma-HCH transport system ATP-binding protein